MQLVGLTALWDLGNGPLNNRMSIRMETHGGVIKHANYSAFSVAIQGFRLSVSSQLVTSDYFQLL